jgi:ribosomal protein S27E
VTGLPPLAPGGVSRCPSCGSSEVQLRAAVGKLVCLFCREEWAEELFDAIGAGEDLSTLRGATIHAGASEIDSGAGDLVTLKCGGCGAEVVVNTAGQVGARCHWCRHNLTINEQIPNGAVPDALLPFTVTHDSAVEIIEEFASRRRTFADRKFLREFAPFNVVGVYLPYMVVDVRASGDVTGVGEVETRRYRRGSGNSKTTYYDADVYEVTRHLDFTVDDLALEASAERANKNTKENTNNVINTILPFDTENAVSWNASYLTGFTSERRDRDVSHLVPTLEHKLLSILRSQVGPSVARYGRGVRWESERVEVHGTRWVAMYLPVWLYSYYHIERRKGVVHYIAVNGRTGEVMGSIPVSRPRMLAAAVSAGVVAQTASTALLWAWLQ